MPTLTYRVATQAKGTPLHSWLMVCQTDTPPAVKAGMTVSKWMAVSALELLVKPEIIAQAWKEHKGYLAETKYFHPIPANLKVPTFKDLYGFDPEAVPGKEK